MIKNNKPLLMELGHIILEKRTTYGTNKKGVPLYRFVSHQGNNTKRVVAYKKVNKNETTNVYAVVQPTEDTNKVSIVQIIGQIGNKAAEYEYLLHKNNLLSKQIKVQQPKCYYENIINEELTRRECINAFTIDPATCKDYDDAFSVQTIYNRIIIGVHIADVSFLVQPETMLDIIALNNLSTVYPAIKEPIHMLPKIICEDLMSLKEKTKKLCVSVYYTYENNNCINYKIVRDSVYIKKNYSYENAISKDINTLFNLSKSKDSHDLVAYWMVKTNITIANEITKNKSCILRVYNGKNENLNNNLNETQKLQYKGLYYDSANYIISNNKDDKHSMFDNIYTHFTSPLRRYCDIIVHRYLFSDYKIDDSIIKSINNKNTLLNKLKRGEEKLNIIYELEEYWSKNTIHFKTTGIVLKTEPLYVSIKILDKSFLLKVKSEKKFELFNSVIVFLIPTIKHERKKLLINIQ
jgi:exoribonuclease R|uniref:RNB domain-containing protein n=1 Tax=viral metagenome TaxID=1070528 RepID=A0A6C0J6R4_9ZZZZ